MNHCIPILLILTNTLFGVSDAPFYEDKQDLLHYLDDANAPHKVDDAAEWEIRRSHILTNMQKVMGELPDSPVNTNPSFIMEEEREFARYVRKRIRYRVDDDEVPAYLLIPKNVVSPGIGVVCPHPTNRDGKDMVVGLVDKPNRNYAEELAERGHVTIAPDYAGFGDYADVDVYAMGYASATMKGIRNHMHAVSLLQSLPEVDPEKIAAIGHSLGGHNALFLGAFDSRVKVMVSSCGFNSFPKYYGGDLTGWSHRGYMPRIASVYGKDPSKMPFDWTEILGVLAPRSVFVSAPLHDANFEVSGVRDCERAARPIYELLDFPQHLRVVYPDCEHDFPPDVRAEAYDFIEKALAAD